MNKSRKTTLENRSQQSGFVVSPGAPHKDAPADWLGFPARSLTPSRIAGYFDDATRGDWTMAQWMMYHAILRDADILALVRQRKAALRGYSVNIQQVKGVDDALAAEQAKALKSRYDQFDNLGEAVDHLALAPFCHYAHVAIGETALEPLDQIWFVRDGLYGPWKYNPEARVTTGKDTTLKLIDESRYLIRVDAHSVFWLALAKYIRSNFSQKWWDAFAEAVSKMGTVVIGPENVPADKVDAFVTNAERISKGGSGALPHSSTIIATNATRGAIPFGEHMAWLRDSLIRAVNGSTLANVAEQGSGTLAGGAHQNTYREIIHGEARTISEQFQIKIDKPLLAEAFPNKPILAYFELGLKESMDVQKEVANIMQLASVGYPVETAMVEARTGYKMGGPIGTPKGTLGADGGTAGVSADAGKAAPAAPVEDVQAAALNGAQVSSMVGIISAAAAGTIPEASVMPLLRAAFPLIDERTLSQIVGPLKSFEATPPQGAAGPVLNREFIENFDPDQPRGDGGKWPESGGGGVGAGHALRSGNMGDDPQKAEGALKVGGRAKIDGHDIEVLSVKKQTRKVSVPHDTDPSGPSTIREYTVVSVTGRNKWGQTTSHKFGGIDFGKGGRSSVANRAAESIGVPESWLAPVADLLAEIEAKAADKGVSDADLLAFLESAKKRAPELFGKMDVEALADTLEKVMGGGMLDGAREALRSRKGA